MNSPSDDIADLLEASSAGTGLTVGTELFSNYMPKSPDTAVAIFDTGGFEPESGYDYDKPTIQVICRANSYADAYSNASTIKDYLHTLTKVTQGGAKYIGIWAFTDIMNIGEDENDRATVSVNFRIHRTPTS